MIQTTFRSVLALFITWKSLNSADSVLSSAVGGNFQSKKSQLNSADFLWNSAEQPWFLNISEWQFLVNFTLFQNFSKYLNFEADILVFNPIYEKKWATKIYFSIFVQARDITHIWIFGFTAQVTKQIWFNFSKTFLRL